MKTSTRFIIVIILIVIIFFLFARSLNFSNTATPINNTPVTPVVNSTVNIDMPLTEDCNGEESLKTRDKCVEQAVTTAATDIVNAINNQPSDAQILQDILTELRAGLDVRLIELGPTVQTQLQALIEAALNAVEPLQVEVTNFTDSQATLQAALTWAANNLQFNVIASQNGNWTIDLTAATVSAIQNAFTTALGSTTVDVDITNNPVTVTLDAASLTALENTTVTIAGQPVQITGNVVASGTVALDAATVTAIATAIAGEDINVNILGQPITIAGTIDLGDVSALTDWFGSNDLSFDDAAIISAINTASLVDHTDDDVQVVWTAPYEMGCDPNTGRKWFRYTRRRYDELGNTIDTLQLYASGGFSTTTAPTNLVTCGASNVHMEITPAVEMGCDTSGVKWFRYDTVRYDNEGNIISIIPTWDDGRSSFNVPPAGPIDECPMIEVEHTPAVLMGCSTSYYDKWYTYDEVKYDKRGDEVSRNTVYVSDGIKSNTLPAGGVSDCDIFKNNVETGPWVSQGCDLTGQEWFAYQERIYDQEGTQVSTTLQFTDGQGSFNNLPPDVRNGNCGITSLISNCVSFGGTNDEVLPVAPGTLGNLVYIADHGTGLVRFSMDGTSPTSDLYPEVTAWQYPNPLHGVDLSLLVFNGSSTASDYTVCYEIPS